MSRWKVRFLHITMGFLVAVFVIAPALAAWEASVFYGHSAPFGGEANEGWHRGEVAISAPRRDVIAGDDYIKWSTSTASWANSHRESSNNTERAAIVYHAFAPNSSSCGDIEIIRPTWIYSNLPAWDEFQKDTCYPFGGNWNETRFLIYGNITANYAYFVWEYFNDWRYEFGGGQRAAGEITVDSYWDKDDWIAGHKAVYRDHHGKFCVSASHDAAYVSTGGYC